MYYPYVSLQYMWLLKSLLCIPLYEVVTLVRGIQASGSSLCMYTTSGHSSINCGHVFSALDHDSGGTCQVMAAPERLQQVELQSGNPTRDNRGICVTLVLQNFALVTVGGQAELTTQKECLSRIDCYGKVCGHCVLVLWWIREQLPGSIKRSLV